MADTSVSREIPDEAFARAAQAMVVFKQVSGGSADAWSTFHEGLGFRGAEDDRHARLSATILESMCASEWGAGRVLSDEQAELGVLVARLGVTFGLLLARECGWSLGSEVPDPPAGWMGS